MPSDALIPVLAYPSVGDAIGWLEAAFGFGRRWQIVDHRAQVAVGESAAIAIIAGEVPPRSADHVMIRVEGIEAHRERAAAAGATVGPIESFPYGERQYTAVDFAGRSWVFSESVADVDPRDWGASTP
jgi:uncharacterized glyoxalase superfamily protein PhnB